MTILVAGKITVKPGTREQFLTASKEALLLARENKTCYDFSVSPDIVDPNRINIFEKWASRTALEAFRNSGPEDESFSMITAFDVHEYELAT
ncbi:MAG: putative quinol monooxygenase [Gammaproteobacteria bacterium]